MLRTMDNKLTAAGAAFSPKGRALALCLLFFFLFFFPSPGRAHVTGRCDNCHTMHNSQNGAAVVASIDAPASGGKGPLAHLLRKDCVGCHTNSVDGKTMVVSNGTTYPIVFNTHVPTENVLAGGNFYWVAQTGGDAFGHNVYPIAGVDQTLSRAPGSITCAGCHTSLATSDTGCTGCHNSVRHHGTVRYPNPENASSGWYRFLSAPEDTDHTGVGGAPVLGIEDPNWEHNADASHHNVYYGGVSGSNEDTASPESMGKFCAGCHLGFHSNGATFSAGGVNVNNGSGAPGNPWLRHPADFAIPTVGEYGDIIGTSYDPTVPVGKPMTTDSGPAPDSATGNTVQAGDTVICVSCHRAHGSPYADMLRWSYSEMEINTTGAGAGKGCFKCHSQKDGK